MGCAGSRKDVGVNQEVGKWEAVRESEVKVEKVREDEEILVINEGKSISKSKLDEITENNLSSSRVEGKNDRQKDKENDTKGEPVLDAHTKSLYVGKTENFSEKDELAKAKTGKVEFENHPHEFDFSFIEENKKKIKEDDLLTDQILKEINDEPY